MRFTLLLVTACCLNASADGFAQKVTLHRRDARLEDVFRVITRQTGYTFVYTESDIRKARPVSLALQDAPLEEALRSCFGEQPLEASILGMHIVVKERARPVEPVPPPPPGGGLLQ